MSHMPQSQLELIDAAMKGECFYKLMSGIS